MPLGLFWRPESKAVENLDNKIAYTHIASFADAPGFEAAQTELRSIGVLFDGPEDTGIALSIFFSDPDGHQLEITTYHPVPKDEASDAVAYTACAER